MNQGSRLTQTQLLRQRLLPQQLRLVALVEKTDEEIEQEIAREIEENPALEGVATPIRVASSGYSGERLDAISYGSFVSKVESVNGAEVSDAPIYDILGRQIANPAPGQLYIQAGKKHIAK